MSSGASSPRPAASSTSGSRASLARRGATGGNTLAHIEGFGGRGGFGRRPALVVIDMTLGFTDSDSPLACDLEGPVSEIQKLLEAARRAEIPIVFTTAAGVDTLIIAGASTSGCVRATAVDALQYGFRPVVPREAVGDRNRDAQEANLYDIDAKYGDVVPTEDVLEYLQEVAATHAR